MRDDLRQSMAKDATTIKNENLVVGDNNVRMEEPRHGNVQVAFSHLSVDSQKHFQKKITPQELHNHPLEFEASGFSGHEDFPRLLAGNVDLKIVFNFKNRFLLKYYSFVLIWGKCDYFLCFQLHVDVCSQSAFS